MPSTTMKLTVNVPLRLQVTGAAIWPGKLWQGKQLPAQLALKGTVPGSGDPVTVYVAAELASVLVAAGATKREIQSKDAKGTGFDLPKDKTLWEVCKRQAAGEKYPHDELYEPGAPPTFSESPKALQTAPEVMPWDGKPAVEREAGEMSPLESLFDLYRECLTFVLALQREHPEANLDTAAATATCFIQATKQGAR